VSFAIKTFPEKMENHQKKDCQKFLQEKTRKCCGKELPETMENCQKKGC